MYIFKKGREDGSFELKKGWVSPLEWEDSLADP